MKRNVTVFKNISLLTQMRHRDTQTKRARVHMCWDDKMSKLNLCWQTSSACFFVVVVPRTWICLVTYSMLSYLHGNYRMHMGRPCNSCIASFKEWMDIEHKPEQWMFKHKRMGQLHKICTESEKLGIKNTRE